MPESPHKAAARDPGLVRNRDDGRPPATFEEPLGRVEDGTVVWPGRADLAPDTLYERVRTGAWPDHDVGA